MNFDVLIKVVLAVLETFTFFALGGFAVGRKMVDEKSLRGFSRFTINVLTPFMVFSSIAGKFTREDLYTAWIFPVAGFLMMLFHAALGYIFLPGMRNRTPARRATFLHMATVNNYIYLPIIVIGYLFPGKTVAALLLWSVGATMGQWTIGIAVMAVDDVKKLFLNLVSPNSIVAFGAVIYLIQPFRLPVEVINFTTKVGDLAIPLCLVLIGASIWIARSQWTAHLLDLFYTTFLRIVVMPLLTLLVLKFIPLPEIARNIAVVLAVMPASCGSVLIVREYGGDAEFAGQIVLATTLFSLVTMPLLLAFFL